MTEKEPIVATITKVHEWERKGYQSGTVTFEVAVTPGEFMELDFTEPVLISQGWDDIDEDS